MPNTDIPILDDAAIAEIEARDWHLNGALEKRIALSPAERDALVAMVRRFNEHYENLMRAALLREQKVAISMRSACVEKVKERARAHRKRATDIDYGQIVDVPINSAQYRELADELDRAALELESVTLQEQEAKQS